MKTVLIVLAVVLAALFPLFWWVRRAVRKIASRTNLFDHLTTESQAALALAVGAAQSLDYSEVGSAHLLYGLALRKTTAAARLLRAAGVGAERIRPRMRELFPPDGPAPKPAPDTPPVGQDLRAVLGKSLAIAAPGRGIAPVKGARLGVPFIGPEHLLLAILARPDCAGAKILAHAGVDAGALRADLITAATGNR